jgi:hypothetical protein
VEREGYWTKAEGESSSHEVINTSRRFKLVGFEGKYGTKYGRKCEGGCRKSGRRNLGVACVEISSFRLLQ